MFALEALIWILVNTTHRDLNDIAHRLGRRPDALRRLIDLAAEVHDASTSFDIANGLQESLHGRAREAHAVEARCKTATNKNAI